MSLSKEDIHELVELKRSIGEDFDDDAFRHWLKQKDRTDGDPIAVKLVRALKALEFDKSIMLDENGYQITRATGETGFSVSRIEKS